MIKFRAPFATTAFLLWLCLGFVPAHAQEKNLTITGGNPGETNGFYYEATGLLTITNNVLVTYPEPGGMLVLTADRATVNEKTGDIYADGHVRIQLASETWLGEHLHYNYKTKAMDGEQFRMGKSPIYASGDQVHSTDSYTNGVYTVTNAFVSLDDYYEPMEKVRAREFTVVEGKYVEAHDATLLVNDVPVFYFPYYRKSLKDNPNNFSFIPGYRSRFGPFLLSSYNWVYNEELAGALHVDLRQKRGIGVGPDFDFNLGKYGTANFKYYYTHDDRPGTDPFTAFPLPSDRKRAYFSYIGTPATNLTVLGQVAYQSDPYIIRDFFESQYQKDIEPNTFLEANQFWRNWSLDGLAQTRVNPFFESVERLPDVRLTGYKQQIGNSPLFYESQSSLGYFRRLYSETNLAPNNPADYSASRADTFHQITLPQNYFGWLNFTPRVGGRFSYYTSASGPGAVTNEHSREVFNTGAEMSFTASRVWSGVSSHFWDVDGLRHIIEPSINYVYIPRPNVLPSQLPQFDYELTNSLRLLPIDFPDYNSIDSIDAQNTIRYGVNNRLQTRRDGGIVDYVNWSTYLDWHIKRRSDQSLFSDVYNDISIRPRSWLTLESATRINVHGLFEAEQHRITFKPNDTWSWTAGHYYLRSGTIFGPTGANLFTSTFFFRLNENWGTRIAHYFDVNTGKLQEQDYTIYRDVRSWTAALTFRALNNLNNGTDYSVAFTFSLKAHPRYALGQDSVNASPLLGY